MIKSVSALVNGLGKNYHLNFQVHWSFTNHWSTWQYSHTPYPLDSLSLLWTQWDSGVRSEDVQKEGYGWENIYALKIRDGTSLWTYRWRRSWANALFSILWYAIIAMFAIKCRQTKTKTVTIKWTKAVVHINGSHITFELTKEQKTLLEELSVELHW